MITQAIQGKCKAVMPQSYTSIGDENFNAPYCVHRENATPEYMKGVIVQWIYECEIAIVCVDPADLESNATSIRSGIEALEGTVTNGTTIQDVTYLGDTPDYDQEEKLYVTLLRFQITTKNR